jgi:hypothetical protein
VSWLDLRHECINASSVLCLMILKNVHYMCLWQTTKHGQLCGNQIVLHPRTFTSKYYTTYHLGLFVDNKQKPFLVHVVCIKHCNRLTICIVQMDFSTPLSWKQWCWDLHFEYFYWGKYVTCVHHRRQLVCGTVVPPIRGHPLGVRRLQVSSHRGTFQ